MFAVIYSLLRKWYLPVYLPVSDHGSDLQFETFLIPMPPEM